MVSLWTYKKKKKLSFVVQNDVVCRGHTQSVCSENVYTYLSESDAQYNRTLAVARTVNDRRRRDRSTFDVAHYNQSLEQKNSVEKRF